MKVEIQPTHIKITGKDKTRPVFLSVLCIFSIVYFSLLTILFLVGIFYSGTITKVIDQYAPEEIFTKMQIRMVFTGGFLLHILGLSGTVMLWNLRKTGYYLLSLSCLITALFQIFRPDIAVTSTVVYILMILLFGIFFKRLN